MTLTTLQQQVFALDARFNAQRAPASPNFKTLYIRRRSQLLRETDRDPDKWKQYLRLRSILLQDHYGGSGIDAYSTSLTRKMGNDSTDSLMGANVHNVVDSGDYVVPTKEAEASRAMVGGNSIAENYAFVGVHHIFDQHLKAVTMIKFANNDRSKLCCASLDANLSICDVTSEPPVILAILKGHTQGVTGFDWSADNDLIVSISLDGTSRVWKVSNYSCLRIVKDSLNSNILCCLFQPLNNNLFVTGNSKGELKVANVSTGLYMKNVCRIGGNVLSLTVDTSGKMFWAGNDRGEIVAIFCEVNGNLCRTKKIRLTPDCSITSLSYRAWISREARDPLVLVNATNDFMYLFRVTDYEGTLQLKQKFQNRHQRHMVRSAFCPIMSFRQGACVVTGSEDGSIYFIDVEKEGRKAILNTLQGHSSAVLGISFNYNESLLATCDLHGLVIIWKRRNLEP